MLGDAFYIQDSDSSGQCTLQTTMQVRQVHLFVETKVHHFTAGRETQWQRCGEIDLGLGMKSLCVCQRQPRTTRGALPYGMQIEIADVF